MSVNGFNLANLSTKLKMDLYRSVNVKYRWYSISYNKYWPQVFLTQGTHLNPLIKRKVWQKKKKVMKKDSEGIIQETELGNTSTNPDLGTFKASMINEEVISSAAKKQDKETVQQPI